MKKETRENIATMGSVASMVAIPLALAALLNEKPEESQEMTGTYDKAAQLRAEKKQIKKQTQAVKKENRLKRKNEYDSRRNQIRGYAKDIGYDRPIIMPNAEPGADCYRVCQSCGNRWEDKYGTDRCPFCGGHDTFLRCGTEVRSYGMKPHHHRISMGGGFVDGIPVNRDGYVSRRYMKNVARQEPGYRRDRMRDASVIYPSKITVDQYRRASRPGIDIEDIDTRHGKANVAVEKPDYLDTVSRRRARR